MDQTQHKDLLELLKSLAQDQRLLIVNYLSQREYNVTELAQVLELSEPTVSHHLSKLHVVGLVRLRMDGNQRFYSVNQKRLTTFKQYVHTMEAPITLADPETSPDHSWMDALDWSVDEKKVLKDHIANQKLVRLPTKEKKWLVILKWLASHFEHDKRYTEKEVNAILTPIHPDYAITRRNLVEYGFMRRERGGSQYWLTPEHDDHDSQ